MGLVTGKIKRGMPIAIVVMALVISLSVRAEDAGKHGDALGLIPAPQKLVRNPGYYNLTASTRVTAADDASSAVAESLVSMLRPVTGYKLPIHRVKKHSANAIHFRIDAAIEAPEGYRLEVSKDRVELIGASKTGLYWAAQTLRQLLPTDIELSDPINKREWPIARVNIVDAPRFRYRGMHLDVARHFFTLAELKQYIDLLALHKMNYFHLHLTDDQGWRMEIKRFPKLTQIGSVRDKTVLGHTYDYMPIFDNTVHQGFYTQQQLRELDSYAQERMITIVPEIDIPGHSSALLAAYPELGCRSKPYKVESRFGIFEPILCPRESTFTFLQQVFTEVAATFSGDYIHIGGDEALKTEWENSDEVSQLMKTLKISDYDQLQAYFVTRVDKIVSELNRQTVGWDEILDGEEASNATVMSWRGIEGGIAAARQGRDVIMSPYEWLYFDHYQSRNLNEPKAIHGLTPLKKVYHYDPVPNALSAQQATKVIGASGALWTEYIRDFQQVQYMLLPRMTALSEVLWSETENKHWLSFNRRLERQYRRFDKMSVAASRSQNNVSANSRVISSDLIELSLQTDGINQQILFTIDGADVDMGAKRYTKPLFISEPTLVKAKSQSKDTGQLYGDFHMTLMPHKGLGKPIVYTHDPEGGGVSVMQDGVMAFDQHYNVGDWGVFYGTDMIATVDLNKVTEISEILMSVDAGRHRQLHPPKRVKIEVSEDNKNWRLLQDQSEELSDQGPLLKFSFDKVEAKYVRVQVVNKNNSSDHQIPKLPLYIDEIVIR